MKRVITYGTFDILHYGHINILKRAKALGDYLIVVLSSDEFNLLKNKKSYYTYEQRKIICDYLKQEITNEALNLPKHKVVPYDNLSKKDYPYSK